MVHICFQPHNKFVQLIAAVYQEKLTGQLESYTFLLLTSNSRFLDQQKLTFLFFLLTEKWQQYENSIDNM